MEFQPQPPAKRTLYSTVDGKGSTEGSALIVLGFHHLSLLLALFNLSLNYCLLIMLIANMYLFTVNFDFTRFFPPCPFLLSVLFILMMHDQAKT